MCVCVCVCVKPTRDGGHLATLKTDLLRPRSLTCKRRTWRLIGLDDYL